MLPYQPNSDVVLPPAVWPPFVVPLPSDGDALFDVATFLRRSGDRRPLSAFDDGLEKAFATSVFLGVGFGIDLGVALGFGVCVAAGLGVDAAVGVGFGVGDGNSISLLAVTTGVSFSASPSFEVFGSGAVACFDGGDASFSDSRAPRSFVPPNQTMLSGFDEALAARLQRIRTAISATCASAIRTTFRQKGFATLILQALNS